MARYDDDDGPSGDDWRALDGKPLEAVRSDDWQRLDTSEAEDEAKQPWSRRTKLSLVAAALALVVAVAAWVISWSRPDRAACILLAGARYDTNLLLPANVLGWKGLQDIEEWAPPDAMGERWVFWTPYKRMRRVGSLNQHELTEKTWAKLKESLPELSEGRFKEDTLVVFLSLFGATDASGAPVLFLDDPLGKAVLPVQTVIDDLKALQDEAAKRDDSARKTIVLLLDAVPVENHWPLGVFGNKFAEGMEALQDDLPDGMYVICSCAKGQRSWVSEEWRRSIFAHYVLMGLRGAADTEHDRKVSLEDLFAYVEAKVQSWALGNRDTPQTPIFLGKRADAADIDLVRVEQTVFEDPPEAAAGKEFTGLSDALKREWDKWHELKAGAGWAYAPQLWRQYQDALLRWEHLERTGCSDRWRTLQDLARRNAKALEEAQPIKLPTDCLGSSIPFARGMGHAAHAPALANARKLWALWEDRWPKVAALKDDKAWRAAQLAWEGALKEGKESPSALYARLASVPIDALLDDQKAKTLQRDHLGKAAAFLKELAKSDIVPPIEAHFLIMLDKCALKEVPEELLRDALFLRRLAEQTIMGVDGAETNAVTPSYCEFVFPLIKSKVEQADKKRRDGEDLLLGAKSDWDEAKKSLAAAKEAFKKIQDQANMLRQAFAARDRAAAELPYLAQWLSQHPVAQDPKKKTQVGREELKKGLDDLSAGIGKLAGLTAELEEYRKADQLQGAILLKLEEWTKAVQAKRADLDKAYDDLYDKVSGKVPTVDQLYYHQIECLLNVPLFEGKLSGNLGKQREELVRKSRKVTASLNLETTEHQVDVARRKIGFAESAQLEELARQLYAPVAGDLKERLFDALARLPEQIRNGRDRSVEHSDLVQAKELLRMPAEYSRLIPGGRVAEDEIKQEPFTAPEGWRRLHAHDVLLFLADRSHQDHWYKEDEATPYYEKPVDAYTNAAGKLAEGKANNLVKVKDARASSAKSLAKALKEPALLTVVPDPVTAKVGWTTERSLSVRWKIEANAKVPPGKPMAVLDGEPLKRETQANLWRDGNIPQAQPFKRDLEETSDKPPDGQTKKVRLNVLYRGQRRAAEIEVSAHPPSLIVDRLEPPQTQTAHLAVRLDKNLKYGALSIVLDNSGSMAYIHKEDGKIVNKEIVGDHADPKKKRRYDYAVDALETLLGSMPALEHLSVVRFNSANNSKPELWKQYVNWKAETQGGSLIDALRVLGSAKEKDLYVGLHNFSPIAKAIELSMDGGFPKNYEGPKVVLVLTDGADNYSFEKGIPPTPKNTKEVHKFLFQTSPEDYKNTKVVTVCFIQPVDKDYDIAKAQFDSETPRKDRFFLTVQDGDKLAGAIRELLRPRLQLTAPERDPEKYYVNEPEGIDWHRIKGLRFRGKVLWHQLDFDRISQEIQFERGQNMLLTVKRGTDTDFSLERSPVAKQDETKDRKNWSEIVKKHDDWFALLHESQRFQGKLSQLLLLEKEPDKAGPVTQPRPEMVWLDLASSAEKGAAFGPTRWKDDWTAAAPAYRLVAEGWPDKETPRLKAFWQKDFPTDPRLCVRWRADDPNRKIKVGATWCEIEIIAAESMKDRPGKALVVRVKHDIGHPVWLRLARWGGGKEATERAGGWPAGHEHRYFPDVGKYTVSFYPWQYNDDTGAEFDVLCLDSFKKDPARPHAAFEPVADVRMPPNDRFYGTKIVAP
jgi:hypothetical protein